MGFGKMLYVASNLSLGLGSGSALDEPSPTALRQDPPTKEVPGPDAHKGFSGGGFSSGCRV